MDLGQKGALQWNEKDTLYLALPTHHSSTCVILTLIVEYQNTHVERDPTRITESSPRNLNIYCLFPGNTINLKVLDFWVS